MVTLSEAQKAFRQTPNRLNALAYMDAAITAFESLDTVAELCSDHAHRVFSTRMQEIRDWLRIESDPFSRGFTIDTKDNQ